MAAGALSLAAAAPVEAARPTGRHLVRFEKASTAASSSAVSAVLSKAGARRAGRGVPAFGIATVRGPAAAIARLRRDPRVRSVSVEWERDLRRIPNDPALSTPETEFTAGVPPGTPCSGRSRAQGFPHGLGRHHGRRRGGGRARHRRRRRQPGARRQDRQRRRRGHHRPLSDADGHGTHTAGLACAATDNGIGIAGAGFGCRLAVVKLGTTITGGIRDEDIVDAIRVATDRGAHVINMSFGGGATNAVLRQAIAYAVSRGVVLVASASNDDVADQGAPAVELQPGDAPDINAGRGLVVTAAEFDDTRAGTGFGSQISLAAYGFFDDGTLGPPGLISSYPRNATPREGLTPLDGCDCRRSLSDGDHYAYLQGTSMAAPQVAGLAALISGPQPLPLAARQAHPDQAARPAAPAAGTLSWAGGSSTPVRPWRRRGGSTAVRRPRRRARSKRVRLKRGRRRAALRVRWSGTDPGGRPGLLPAGVRDYDLYAKRGRGRYRRVRRANRRRVGGAEPAPGHLPLLHPRPRPRRQPRGQAAAGRRAGGGQAAAVDAASRPPPPAPPATPRGSPRSAPGRASRRSRPAGRSRACRCSSSPRSPARGSRAGTPRARSPASRGPSGRAGTAGRGRWSRSG